MKTCEKNIGANNGKKKMVFKKTRRRVKLLVRMLIRLLIMLLLIKKVKMAKKDKRLIRI